MSLEHRANDGAAETEPLLEVDSISVEFTQDGEVIRALRDVSLSVSRGETVGIAGESGSGKSTLAEAIVRYLDENGRIANGTIRFEGEDLLSKTETQLRSIRGNRIAHVAQSPEKALNPALTIGEQIKEVVTIHQDVGDDEGAMVQVHDVLEQVNIPDPEYAATQYPHELSGGMQQRALIALSLSCNPDLLILDEPTTGLDVTTQAKILDLIEELKTDYDASIVLISHNLAVISDIADRVNILYAGRIMERGTVEDVFTDPSNPYTQGLLAAIPRLSKENNFSPIPGQIPELSDVPDGCVFAERCPFATEECESGEIEMHTVQDEPRHATRCIHAEAAREDPIRTDQTATEADERGAPLIRARNVKKYYGDTGALDRVFGGAPPVKAVDGVDLTIHESETVGLVGESGCGKSTFGKVLLDLVDATEGTISFRGKDVHSLEGEALKQFRSECQIIFQHPDSSLNDRKRVYHTLERPIELFTDLDSDEREQRVMELLEQVNLPASMAAKFPHELSGGEQQRVAIARAFAANPSFIVLDEPVASLDVSVQANILNLLEDLRERYDTSYLFISHDLSVVEAICDRLAVMYLGNVVETGTTDDIFEPPYHPYTRALLSSAPTVDPDDEEPRIHLSGDVPSARNPPSGCPFRTRCPQKIGDVCENEDPPLEDVESSCNGHRVACHLEEPEMARDTESVIAEVESESGEADSSD